MSARVTVLTAGHLSMCPRMLKAADALVEAGYRVRVVSTRFVPWGFAADADLVARRKGAWSWTAVDYRPESGLLHGWSRLRRKSAELVADRVGLERASLDLLANTVNRVHPELVKAVLAEPSDLIYAGSAGALATAALAGRKKGVRYALDLEDFHTGERPPNDPLTAVYARIEREVLPGASFVTTANEPMASAYENLYRIRARVVHNTFALPSDPPPLEPGPRGLRIAWFGQTIGPGRGLEQAIDLLGRVGGSAVFEIRGRALEEFWDELDRRASEVAPNLVLVRRPPCPPDELIPALRGADVGLALEPGEPLNNRLLLSNKALTYPLAGLAVAISATPGQRDYAAALGEGAVVAEPGDVETLAAGLAAWSKDRKKLARARRAAWEAARSRWHFEHPEERGVLLAAVREALGR
jgi:glycosyltransferase involved in cell wall biosynthesis